MDKTTVIAYANYAKEKLKKNSPKILLGVGIASGLAAISYAIKVSMEVEPILDDHTIRVNDKKALLDLESNFDEEDIVYTEKEYKADLVKEYLRTAGYFAKLYAPVFALEAASIGTICAGFGILDKRYISAAAAFASTYAEYADYRNRVAAKYGEEAEYDIYNNIVEETVETVDEDGKKKKEKIKVAKNTEPGTCVFYMGKDYCNFYDDRMTDEQFCAEMKIRLAAALSNSNRDVNMNGHTYLDKIAERLGVQQRHAYRELAIVYNPDFGTDQISVKTNVKIRDAHILEGGEKVIMVEIKGLVPFNIDNWDPIEDFLKLKVNN